MKQLCTALFLLHALLTVSGVENITEGSQDVSCTESEELCLSSNSTATSIYVINTKMSCCAAGYEMAWIDQSCSCKKTKEAIACNTGEDACASAEYAVLDDSGTKRCCPDNSTLQSFRFRLKGKKLFTCACLLDTQENGAWMSSYGLSFLDSQDAFNATALIGDIAVNQNAWADYAYRMANNMWKVLQNAFRWF